MMARHACWNWNWSNLRCSPRMQMASPRGLPAPSCDVHSSRHHQARRTGIMDDVNVTAKPPLPRNVRLLFGTLLTIIIGPLSDRGGRRAFLLGYDALQALVALVAMLTSAPWLLVAAAVVGGFGRGANGSAGPFSPVEQAWLAIELPMQRRGSVFSANSAVGFIGMGIG